MSLFFTALSVLTSLTGVATSNTLDTTVVDLSNICSLVGEAYSINAVDEITNEVIEITNATYSLLNNEDYEDIDLTKLDLSCFSSVDLIYYNDIYDLKNYKNSLNFVKAVKEARKFEKSHEKLLIIAGACQSNYEELIKAGADFASSPKRINIHALDPAIIATSLSLLEKNKEVNLIELLKKTKYGKDGMGGLIVNGLMYVGYPR